QPSRLTLSHAALEHFRRSRRGRNCCSRKGSPIMLKFAPFLAAAATPADLKNEPITTAASGFMSDLLLVLGLGVVLAAALFLIVYLARKDKKSRNDSGSRVIYRASRRSGELRSSDPAEH